MWAVALHGGAGVISKDISQEDKEKYVRGLVAALDVGAKLAAAGSTALQVVEAVVITLEDNPLFNAGKGAVYNAAKKHEYD